LKKRTTTRILKGRAKLISKEEARLISKLEEQQQTAKKFRRATTNNLKGHIRAEGRGNRT